MDCATTGGAISQWSRTASGRAFTVLVFFIPGRFGWVDSLELLSALAEFRGFMDEALDECIQAAMTYGRDLDQKAECIMDRLQSAYNRPAVQVLVLAIHSVIGEALDDGGIVRLSNPTYNFDIFILPKSFVV